jgi:hypothetical protein
MVTTTDDIRVDTLDLPLAGLTEATIKLNFGGGEMKVHRAPAGSLIGGSFEGGLLNTSRSAGDIELSPLDPHDVVFCGHPKMWDLGITSEIPVDLRLDTGANQSVIDLSQLRIRRLDFNTGASDTTIRLPAKGETVVNIHCGFASAVVEVPEGVAAQIRGRVLLGSTHVDETRFPRLASGVWASRDYSAAKDRVDITVAGGFGSTRIV